MGILGILIAPGHWAFVLILLPVAMALGAFGRRIVGGVLGDDWHIWKVPHTLACIWFAVSIGGAAALGMLPRLLGVPFLHTPWWGPISIGAGAWIGHVAKGLYDATGMGHLPPDNRVFTWKRFARDYAFLSLYGLQVAGLAVLVSLCPDDRGVWWLELLAGLSVAPLYALSWWLWPHERVRIVGVDDNPLPEGEWLWGAALGGLVFLGFALT